MSKLAAAILGAKGGTANSAAQKKARDRNLAKGRTRKAKLKAWRTRRAQAK